jgi:hypothetical protein
MFSGFVTARDRASGQQQDENENEHERSNSDVHKASSTFAATFVPPRLLSET